jgi:SAM-dependent methyltransferase
MKQPADFLRLFLLTVPLPRALVRAVEARLFTELVPQLPEPILDIGCGDGTFAQITLPGKHIIGIDARSCATHEASQQDVYQGLSVATSERLPFKDQCFASSISNCVLEHITPLDETLQEVQRVLQPGGLFAATVVGEQFAQDLLGSRLLQAIGSDGTRYGRWFNRISQHVHTLSASAWRERMTRAGLEVILLRPYLSATALKVFDLSHYYAAPALITRRLTGRWLIYPPYTTNLLWEPLLRRFYDTPSGEDGPYYFILCRKPPHQE